MTQDDKKAEQHGCIVCGKTYHLHLKRDASGRITQCAVVSPPGGRCLPDEDRPIVACSRHSQAEVDRALAGHHPGRQQDPDDEDDR
jgi:hypothetical protein